MRDDYISRVPRGNRDSRGPQPAFVSSSGGLTHDSLFQVMWRRSWIIISCVVLLLIAALVYLAKTTPIYISTSRVYVEPTGPRIVNEMEAGVMTRSINYLYTQAGLMKATPVVSEAVQTCGRLQAFARVDNIIEFLKRNLDVSVGRKDDIISVSFKSAYPAENAQIVNAVVDAYVTFHATRKRSTSAEVLKILQKEKDTRGQELSNRLQTVMEFKENNPTLAFRTERGNTILERFERLSTALTEAQLDTLEAKSYYDAAVRMTDAPAGLQQFVEDYAAKLQVVIPQTETIPLKARLRELQLARSDRMQFVTSEHPSVQALDADIAQIQREIATLDQQLISSHLAVLKQQYLTAKDKEGQLTARFEEQRQQATNLNKVTAQYTVLESEYEQTKKLCDALDDRIREINVTEDTGALNITILEAAQPATEPSDLQSARVMAMALVLGMLVGSGLALLREMTDHRLRNGDEVTTLLGSPILGTVPMMSKREPPGDRAQKAALDSTSDVAEAFRNVRTAVFFSLTHGQSRVIQVTSSMAREGKSTVVSNLGIAMAQSGLTVMIVDADLRWPTQHLTFKTNREKGLSTVLAGMHRLGHVIVRTSTPGLHLLPAGHEVPNPAEMLGSKVFGAVLAKLAQHYDRVLVDSPPIGPVADACILAAQCHATILVVRPGMCTHHALQHAGESLLNVGGRMAGSIVNGVRRGGLWYGRYPYSRRGPGCHGGGNGKRRNTRDHESKFPPLPTGGLQSKRAESRVNVGAEVDGSRV